MFNVVLVEPEIPPNTGNVGRLCLATGSTLHLVKPFGFTLADKQLKRAGLDYWDEVDVKTWESFADLQSANPPSQGRNLTALSSQVARTPVGGSRYFFLTTKAKRAYHDVRFQPGDFLVFGRETKGLPEKLLAANVETCVTIPMHGTRSLNLATAVGIVLFEAVRQQSAG